MDSSEPLARFSPPSAFVALNFVGGIAVLASYVYGMGEPRFVAGMWGGVPEGLRPVYTVSMLLAAAGYFPMTAYVGWRLPTGGAVGAPRGLLNGCYASVLIASALWVPFTLAMLTAPSAGAWFAVRAVLAVAALGSLGILVTLFRAPAEPHGALRKFAIAGCVLFCNQTVLLDSLVWPYFFSAGA